MCLGACGRGRNQARVVAGVGDAGDFAPHLLQEFFALLFLLGGVVVAGVALLLLLLLAVVGGGVGGGRTWGLVGPERFGR